MKKIVIIHEIYQDESPVVCCCDYDLLPKQIRRQADIAISDEHKSTEFNVWEEGLQSAQGLAELEIKEGEQCLFLGSVTFYEKVN